MILVDSNVLMYAAGREHAHRAASIAVLEKIADGKLRAAVDAEVLQEILHRYRSIQRWTEGRMVYDAARTLFAEVLPISGEVMDAARVLLEEYPSLMARDAVHAAVVEVYGLKGICSFDRDFDVIRGLRRVEG